MTLAVRKALLPRQHRYIASGQSVQTEIEVIAGDVAPVLTDSSEIPTFSLYNPSGTQLVTEQPMTRISTGKYKYLYQTISSSPLGQYTGNISVVHLAESARLDRIGLFYVYRTSVLASFSYYAIKDQNGVVWYWYVNAVPELTSSSTVPSHLARSAVDITPVVIPYWLEIDNPTPATRYVHPSLAGEPQVVSSQTGVGTGAVGSPTFEALDGLSYTIGLNVSDEIILNVVS